jgi:hypothetical protein
MNLIHHYYFTENCEIIHHYWCGAGAGALELLLVLTARAHTDACASIFY